MPARGGTCFDFRAISVKAKPLNGLQEVIIRAVSDHVRDCPKELCIHDLIEAQVDKTPHAIAVTLDDTHVTYDELNVRANRLASELRRMGVGPDVRVGLCTDRSIEMVVGILGILKAGGAYVPLDPNYPADHLAFLLGDAQVAAIVAQPHVVNHIVEHWPQSIPIVALDSISAENSGANLLTAARPEHLAYVMYTSGSTGRPKGVMVTHRNLVHSTAARLMSYREPIDGFLLLPSFAFDGSVAVIFWTLCSGGRLVLPPPGAELEPSWLCRLTSHYRVSHVLCVRSLYTRMLDRATPDDLASMRVAVIGGEVCPTTTVASHLEKAPHAQLFNEYGVTECTVWSSVCEISTQPMDLPVPIGRPIANTQMYILDAELQPVPLGVSGELYIGGDGVARGYLNRPDLTSARFVADPFSHLPAARMYRTGDLVRRRADGVIDFLGRLDHQVKVRGFRVEPEEIEAALGQHPSVRAAVVCALEDAYGMRLVAYIVGQPHREPTADGLRSFLKRTLPEFMIPSSFKFVESLPTTATGKVDRRALPTLEQQPRAADQLEPRPPLELQIQAVWAEVLGAESVGLDDGFRDLGGHSLAAVELLTRIEALTRRPLRSADLVEAPTIRKLASLLRQTPHSEPLSPLVPIQPLGSKLAFFCIQSVGGGVLGLQPLARRLGLDQPFYALDITGLDHERATEYRVEEMAVRYLQEIRTVCPEGPYFLSGYCLGGLIALEIARRLEAEDQRVAMLALFDTFNPSYISSLSRLERCEYRVYQIREKSKFHLKALLSEPRHHVAYLSQRVAAVARGVTRRLSRREEPSRRAIEPRPLGVPRDLQHANDLAYQRYIPQPYHGHVTHFRALECGAGVPRLLGWGKVVGSIEIHDVPGDHRTMLQEPHVGVLATRLQMCLTQAALRARVARPQRPFEHVSAS
jgi:amino acid adenylation domain-containing protein